MRQCKSSLFIVILTASGSASQNSVQEQLGMGLGGCDISLLLSSLKAQYMSDSRLFIYFFLPFARIAHIYKSSVMIDSLTLPSLRSWRNSVLVEWDLAVEPSWAAKAATNGEASKRFVPTPFFDHGSAAKTLIAHRHNTASYAGYTLSCFLCVSHILPTNVFVAFLLSSFSEGNSFLGKLVPFFKIKSSSRNSK